MAFFLPLAGFFIGLQCLGEESDLCNEDTVGGFEALWAGL